MHWIAIWIVNGLLLLSLFDFVLFRCCKRDQNENDFSAKIYDTVFVKGLVRDNNITNDEYPVVVEYNNSERQRMDDVVIRPDYVNKKVFFKHKNSQLFFSIFRWNQKRIKIETDDDESIVWMSDIQASDRNINKIGICCSDRKEADSWKDLLRS